MTIKKQITHKHITPLFTRFFLNGESVAHMEVTSRGLQLKMNSDTKGVIVDGIDQAYTTIANKSCEATA